METSRFEAVMAKRLRERKARVEPQAHAALAALRAMGAQVELVGSLARDDFRLHSDVDFLVLDRAGCSRADLFGAVSDHLTASEFDLVFAEDLPRERVAWMLEDVSG